MFRCLTIFNKAQFSSNISLVLLQVGCRWTAQYLEIHTRPALHLLPVLILVVVVCHCFCRSQQLRIHLPVVASLDQCESLLLVDPGQLLPLLRRICHHSYCSSLLISVYWEGLKRPP